MNRKLLTRKQGKVVVEYDYTDRYYYIMFPNGDVYVAKTKRQATAQIKTWLRKEANTAATVAINIATSRRT